MIHLVDATAAAIKAQRLSRVLLLGTRYTMEMDFFSNRLRSSGVEAMIPDADRREFLHRTIYTELTVGVFKPETRAAYVDMIAEAQAEGAEGVILGCTEIPLLLRGCDLPLPTFDTTLIHARAGAEFMLG